MKPYGLNLQKGEEIEWIGKRCLGSLWLPFMLGFLTLPLYGVGIIFIIYAIAKWLKEDYVLTNKRAMIASRKYFSSNYEIRDIFYEEIRGLYTIPRKALIGIYYDLVIENARKIVFKLKEAEMAKKIIEKHREKEIM